MYDLQTLIFYAKEKNTSDVHLTVGLPPMLRIDGELRTHGDVPLTEQDVQEAAQQLADEHQLHELKTIGESDFAVTFADSVRMRCNLFRQQHHTRWRCVCCRWKSRLRGSFACRISLYSRPKSRADWLS